MESPYISSWHRTREVFGSRKNCQGNRLCAVFPEMEHSQSKQSWALSSQLIALVGGLKSAESILSAHCARLKDRAKKNAINETVPQIQDALQRLRLDEEQSSICNTDVAILF